MKFYYITFRSVTFAQRAEKVVTKGGYRCTLQRTPRWMEEQGCGYALKVWTKEITEAVELLRTNHVLLRRIYRQQSDGQLEEIEV